MTNIEVIDYAMNQTYNRFLDYFKNNPEMNYRNLENALLEIIEKGTYQSITSKGQARQYLQELSPIEIESELLKYLVKMVGYKRKTNDPSIGKGVAIGLNDIQQSTPTIYIENGLYDVICSSSNSLDSMDLETGQIGFAWLQEQPFLVEHVIHSFVKNRYQTGLMEEVEQFAQTDTYTSMVVDGIDGYATRVCNFQDNRKR